MVLEAGYGWLPFWIKRLDEHAHSIAAALPPRSKPMGINHLLVRPEYGCRARLRLPRSAPAPQGMPEGGRKGRVYIRFGRGSGRRFRFDDW
mgnify:FL=1